MSLALAGALVMGGSQLYSGYQKQKELNQQSVESARQAEEVKYDGLDALERIEREYDELIGTQKTQFAKSGVDMSGLTPTQIIAQSYEDKAKAESGQRVDSSRKYRSLKERSRQLRKQGSSAMLGSILSAGGTGMSAAGGSKTGGSKGKAGDTNYSAGYKKYATSQVNPTRRPR